MTKLNIPHIAGLMMVKNEKKRFHVTLESIKNIISSLVLFDTGSEDNTISIARTFCEKNNIILRLKEGTFVDFSVSRNVALDFADTFDDIDYLLLLDCNDELQNDKKLVEYCKIHKNNKNANGFMLQQQWWSGSKETYFNVRMIKPRFEWRFHGVVHEYIQSTPDIEKNPVIKLNDIILYQDRTQDDDKSGKRFHRDQILLQKEYDKDPENPDPRNVFYLAQTYSCLNDFANSIKYYDIRAEQDNGFYEEIFHAYLRSGDFCQTLGRDWYSECFPRYMKAFSVWNRVEPLVKIAEFYNKEKCFLFAYSLMKTACELELPECILFIDKLAYDYKRWHHLGISAFYCGKIDEGIEACNKAIKNGLQHEINVDIDRHNLKIYEKEKRKGEGDKPFNTSFNFPNNSESNNSKSNNSESNNSVDNSIDILAIGLTKEKFLQNKKEELKRTNPGLKENIANKMALLAWKQKQKKK